MFVLPDEVYKTVMTTKDNDAFQVGFLLNFRGFKSNTCAWQKQARISNQWVI